MDIWEKYKAESYQTLCIIGILVLSAKLCKADGHFSQHEKDEILKILPHDKNQKRIIENILDEGRQQLVNTFQMDCRKFNMLQEQILERIHRKPKYIYHILPA